MCGDFSFLAVWTGIFVDLPMKTFKVLGEILKNVLNCNDELKRKNYWKKKKKKKTAEGYGGMYFQASFYLEDTCQTQMNL